jgi:hypothetical protein
MEGACQCCVKSWPKLAVAQSASNSRLSNIRDTSVFLDEVRAMFKASSWYWVLATFGGQDARSTSDHGWLEAVAGTQHQLLAYSGPNHRQKFHYFTSSNKDLPTIARKHLELLYQVVD